MKGGGPVLEILAEYLGGFSGCWGGEGCKDGTSGWSAAYGSISRGIVCGYLPPLLFIDS
jgi:hypothetical protein